MTAKDGGNAEKQEQLFGDTHFPRYLQLAFLPVRELMCLAYPSFFDRYNKIYFVRILKHC